jgi:hypothetical protein
MFKTLIILLFAIISIAQHGCKPAKESNEKLSGKEFEGIITYHEISKSSYGLPDVDDTVQLFYAHGNYVNVHSEKSPKFHIVKDYYLEGGPLRLFVDNISDTLYQLNLNFPIENLEGFKVEKVKDKILSRKCENIEVNISYPYKDSTTYTDINYTFSRGYLQIDKQHFKNWDLGFSNKVIDESGALYLKLKTVHFDSSHKNILSSKSYDVISVKEGPIDPKIFEIDTTLKNPRESEPAIRSK